MTIRRDFVADAGEHLGKEVAGVLARHLGILEGGGASAQEACAAALSSLEQYAFATIGAFLVACDEERRIQAFGDAVGSLVRALRAREDELLAAVRVADVFARTAR